MTIKVYDAPPHSLKDSNVSSKVKTTEEKRIEKHSLAYNTLGVEGRVGTLGCGQGWVTSESIIHTDLHKPTTSWLVHSWSTFGAWTNHMHIWTHKTHHGPNLGKATTFPLIVFFVISHRGCIQMSFCPRTPNLGVPKFPKLELLTFWRAILLV